MYAREGGSLCMQEVGALIINARGDRTYHVCKGRRTYYVCMRGSIGELYMHNEYMQEWKGLMMYDAGGGEFIMYARQRRHLGGGTHDVI